MAYLQNRPSGMLGGTPARVKWTELDSEKLRALRIFLLYRLRQRAVFSASFAMGGYGYD